MCPKLIHGRRRGALHLLLAPSRSLMFTNDASNTESFAAPDIVMRSAEMADVLRLAHRAAESDSKVLITGESGVGKDLVARPDRSSP